MAYPVQPSATLSPRQPPASFSSLRNILARPSAVAMEIIAMIVLVIAAILAVLPWARAATGATPGHVARAHVARAHVAPAEMSAPLLRTGWDRRVAASAFVQTLPGSAPGPTT